MKYENIPPQIAAKLNESVARVRRILLVRGTCATLAVFVASVLAIMAIDAMVTIYGTSHVAFGLAPLTQRMLSQIAQAQRLPSLVVQ